MELYGTQEKKMHEKKNTTFILFCWFGSEHERNKISAWRVSLVCAGDYGGGGVGERTEQQSQGVVTMAFSVGVEHHLHTHTHTHTREKHGRAKLKTLI